MQRLSLCLRPALVTRMTLGASVSALQCSRCFASAEAAGSGGAKAEAKEDGKAAGGHSEGAHGKRPHPTQKVGKADSTWNNQSVNKATMVLLTLALALYVAMEAGLIPGATPPSKVDAAERRMEDLAKGLTITGEKSATHGKA